MELKLSQVACRTQELFKLDVAKGYPYVYKVTILSSTECPAVFKKGYHNFSCKIKCFDDRFRSLFD